MRWILASAVVVVAALVAALAYGMTTRRASPPVVQHAPKPITAIATWPAGARPAPAFRLRDQNGAPVSPAAFRGRTEVITFIDPVCTTFCPLEARVLMRATRTLPASDRPVILSVSVNPWENSKHNFARDAARWQLDSSWRWAVGSERQLARVWKAYEIGVAFQTTKVHGVTVRDVAHTEAAYVVDRTGHERALFIWPFSVTDVVTTLRDVSTS